MNLYNAYLPCLRGHYSSHITVMAEDKTMAIVKAIVALNVAIDRNVAEDGYCPYSGIIDMDGSQDHEAMRKEFLNKAKLELDSNLSVVHDGVIISVRV